ncbi:MAG TPA: SGNH/GDSL hydrolase family protein [Armatimonadota bacterium]|nr:SGNH/GDSL hydrolase family protein [Armatimonadota bacterium]
MPYDILKYVAPILLCLSASCSIAMAKPSHIKDAQYPNLVAFFDKLRQGKHVTVAYLGGSITWGATATDPLKTSYRALTTSYLENMYPNAHIKAIDAAIGGTGSLLGVFRMDRDVLPYHPDLTFVEFAVNDGNEPTAQETMEGIIRKLQRSNPHMAIVVLLVGAGWNYGMTPSAAKHEALARHYGLPVINVGNAVMAKLVQGLDSHTILTDGTHPNDNGYRLYSSIVTNELNRLIALKGTAVTSIPAPLTQNRYETAGMVELAKLTNLGDWQVTTPSVTGTWFDHQPSRWFSSVIMPAKDHATLQFSLECRGVGVYYEIMHGGSVFHLSADELPSMDINTNMDLQYARIGYQFSMSNEVKTHMITLTCDERENAKVAYVLYTR